jgi:aspartyl aminopeptidase
MAFASDLLSFLSAVPTPAHLPGHARVLFRRAKFEELDESDDFSVIPKKGFLVHDSAVLAFAGSGRQSALILGASTETSGFVLSPVPSGTESAFLAAPARPSGQPSPVFWTNRDLRAAGEVILRTEDGIASRPYDSRTAIATIPAIPAGAPSVGALQQALASGAPLTAALGTRGKPLAALIAAEFGVPEDGVLDYALSLIDAQPPRVVGADGSLVAAGGLDWLSVAFALLQGFVKGIPKPDGLTVLVIARDFRASWVSDVLARIVGPDIRPFLARSFFVGVQPVDPQPLGKRSSKRTIGIGEGVAILDAPLRSPTDVVSRYPVRHAADKIGVNVRVVSQRYRAWKSGDTEGETIGAVAAKKLGVQAVDIGLPVLGRGALRLTAAIGDVEAVVRLLTELGESFEEHKLVQ